MAKRPPEHLARALRANLKKRKAPAPESPENPPALTPAPGSGAKPAPKTPG